MLSSVTPARKASYLPCPARESQIETTRRHQWANPCQLELRQRQRLGGPIPEPAQCFGTTHFNHSRCYRANSASASRGRDPKRSGINVASLPSFRESTCRRRLPRVRQRNRIRWLLQCALSFTTKRSPQPKLATPSGTRAALIDPLQ